MSKQSPHVVAVGGTLRSSSTTEQAMRHVLAAIERAGGRTTMLCGEALQVGIYEPGNPQRTEAAQHLVRQLSLADAILVASPAYHGTISGLVKNALRGWPTPIGAAISTSDGAVFAADGTCREPRVAQMLELIARQMLGFVRCKAGVMSAEVHLA